MTSTQTPATTGRRTPLRRLRKGTILLDAGPFAVPLRPRAMITVGVGVLLVVILAAYALTIGEYDVTPSQFLDVIAHPGRDPLARYFLLEVRPPRVVAAIVAGLALGVAGALSQTVTGNPLGSPDILGFTTGAATGAVVTIVVFGADLSTAGPAAVVGALLTLALVLGLSRRREDGIPMSRMVLVGIGISACLAGLNRFLISRASVETGMAAALWEAGSLNGILWSRVIGPAIGIVVLLGCCLLVARGLTVIRMGDDATRALGADPGRTRVGAILLSVLLVAAATAIAGPIAFVAMAAPHASRMIAGGERPGLVVSGVTGAVTVLAADVLGRKILPHGELAVGLVTGVVGGIYLIVLLARSWRSGEL